LPYKAQNSKTYQYDCVDDKGLYLIAQYMRVTHERPVLDEIRQFLAAAGAFVDQVRREPDLMVKSVKDADKLLEAFVEYHRKRGKSDEWIDVRLQSTFSRIRFTKALSEFVIEVLVRKHYATATDDVYLGLWGRNAATLRSQMQLSKSDNLRDYQPSIGLQYQGLVEEVCAAKLKKREEVTWDEARDIIQAVAKMIGKHAKETAEMLEMDIATGLDFLPNG
jgi:hypothetical protein